MYILDYWYQISFPYLLLERPTAHPNGQNSKVQSSRNDNYKSKFVKVFYPPYKAGSKNCIHIYRLEDLVLLNNAYTFCLQLDPDTSLD